MKTVKITKGKRAKRPAAVAPPTPPNPVVIPAAFATTAKQLVLRMGRAREALQAAQQQFMAAQQQFQAIGQLHDGLIRGAIEQAGRKPEEFPNFDLVDQPDGSILLTATAGIQEQINSMSVPRGKAQ